MKNVQARFGTYILVFLLNCFLLALSSCQTTPVEKPLDTTATDTAVVDIQTTQGEISKETQAATDTAENIQTIIKEVEVTKVITDVQIKTLTVYTDKHAKEMQGLTELVELQSKQINTAAKLRIENNHNYAFALGAKDIDIAKIKAEKNFYSGLSLKLGIACAILILGIIGYTLLRWKRLLLL